MLLLARLGLRSIEVARLKLDDVHWRIGEVTIRGKARRVDRLPLPVDVGEALVTYLTQARPQSELPAVFLTCRAPRRAITADVVGDLVQQACVRVSIPTVGPHRLRHALATEMVSHGVTLTDISQVLRHRDLATTATYAKIDLESLRALAQPWPGAHR
jgi:site-specific recombinase XerD